MMYGKCSLLGNCLNFAFSNIFYIPFIFVLFFSFCFIPSLILIGCLDI